MQLDLQQLGGGILAAVALAVLALILLVWRFLRQGKPELPSHPASAPPPETPAAPTHELTSITDTSTRHTALLDRRTRHDEAAAAPAPVRPVPVPASPSIRCGELMARVQNHLKTPAPAEAAAVLREIILLASEAGLAEEHASARLELGELSRLDGDLITACEHWQIARGLFHDLRNQARSKAVETRMREHGCPTDWVLNDF